MQPVLSECYRYPSQGQRIMKSFQQKAARLVQRYKVRYLNGIEIRTRDDETRSGVIHRVIYVANARIYYRTSTKTADSHTRQVRYRFSDRNGNARLEIAADATMISREEYYPFGGTAIWLTRIQMGAEYKTHRYAGHERDKTGLIHYGWRYYLPWLMRWLNPDPAGTVDGSNLFCMVKNNPATLRDINGCVAKDSTPVQSSEKRSSFMDNAGKFPFRHAGRPLKLQGWKLENTNGSLQAPQNATELVKPFLDPLLSEESRRELYSQNVRIDTFTQNDVSTNKYLQFTERYLVGQKKLSAKRDLKKDTCIGVYGGQVLSKNALADMDRASLNNLMKCDWAWDRFVLDGDGPMTMMNTIFELNQEGNNIAQATSGYNVNKFLIDSGLEKDSPLYSDLKIFNFAAFFTAKDVREGEELKWDYGYSSKEINLVLSRCAVKPTANTSPLPISHTQRSSYACSLAVLGVGLVLALALWMAYL